ncbi:hypothetical protein PR202_gb22323 [Eleusine coracana subsp. coracana]|uniref:Plant heme peroxidase family profile domain-containing protein n=1 Tax=Eleusine coracana subsp. coracana TaxID=191504 RepID=A0AAV5FG04_ELECO|nr:hypothetical protein PR202_gb22323 [Eleusine coracana subsp. coracana]
MALRLRAIPLAVLLLAILLCGVEASVKELQVGYYAETCPEAEEIVRANMARAQAREARSVASVMRLQFHDCFVNGCDGSVLMDPRPGMPGEKGSLSNTHSLRSFDVVDEIKAALEDRCPGVVSCADIIVMAARDAVVLDLKDLVALRGFLNSDQTLFSDDVRTRRVVKVFSRNQDAFFKAFMKGMVKMGELQNPKMGEIRRNCRVANVVPVAPKEVAADRVLHF